MIQKRLGEYNDIVEKFALKQKHDAKMNLKNIF